jgi:hypothetical protein
MTIASAGWMRWCNAGLVVFANLEETGVPFGIA